MELDKNINEKKYIVKVSIDSDIDLVDIDKSVSEYLKHDIVVTSERVKARGLGQKYTMYVDGDGVEKGLAPNYIATMLYNAKGVGYRLEKINSYIYGDIHICKEVITHGKSEDVPFKLFEIEDLIKTIYIND